MSRPFSGVKVAMLVANGFCQDDMIAAQRALIEAGANVRVVSSENGLVNGWEGQGWGHNFAVDAPLSTALGADYAILVVPGGMRSVEKLKLTAHTKRFVSSFLAAAKPIVIMDDAVAILALTENAGGRTVSGAESARAMIEQAGGTWSEDAVCVDGSLVTGAVDKDSRADFISSVMDHLMQDMMAEQAA